MDPDPARAVVLKAGGTAFPLPLPFVEGGKPGLVGSFDLGGNWEIGAVANFEMMLMKLCIGEVRRHTSGMVGTYCS